jgi:hypothetical protein
MQQGSPRYLVVTKKRLLPTKINCHIMRSKPVICLKENTFIGHTKKPKQETEKEQNRIV